MSSWSTEAWILVIGALFAGVIKIMETWAQTKRNAALDLRAAKKDEYDRLMAEKVTKIDTATDGSLSASKAISDTLRVIGDSKDEEIKALKSTIQQQAQERERLAQTTAMITGNGPKVAPVDSAEPLAVKVENPESDPAHVKVSGEQLAEAVEEAEGKSDGHDLGKTR